MANNLGRGISAFLQEQYDEEDKQSNGVAYLNVSDIEANQFQPRKYFNDDSILSLAASIKEKGVIQPIIVRKSPDGTYELIAGERRLMASKLAGLSKIPAIISNISDKESFELAILENIQREDLNPIDEAEAYKRLMDEFSYTQDGVAKVTGKSRSHIANMLRLLSSDESVQEALIKNLISVGHAKSIMTAQNQKAILDEVLSNGLTVRETEKLVNSLRQNDSSIANFNTNGISHGGKNKDNFQKSKYSTSNDQQENTIRNHFDETYKNSESFPSYKNFTDNENDIDLESISSKISESLRTKVSVKMSNNRGAMLIYFDNLNELDRLLKEITRSDV